MGKYVDVNKLIITIECSDKNIYYYKSNLYAYSKMFRNFVIETGTSDMITVPFKSFRVSVILGMIDYICGNYKGFIKNISFEKSQSLVDMIDYFDFVRKDKFYNIICNSINSDLFAIYKNTHPNQDIYHNIKPCIKFLFDTLKISK